MKFSIKGKLHNGDEFAETANSLDELVTIIRKIQKNKSVSLYTIENKTGKIDLEDIPYIYPIEFQNLLDSCRDEDESTDTAGMFEYMH